MIILFQILFFIAQYNTEAIIKIKQLYTDEEDDGVFLYFSNPVFFPMTYFMNYVLTASGQVPISDDQLEVLNKNVLKTYLDQNKKYFKYQKQRLIEEASFYRGANYLTFTNKIQSYYQDKSALKIIEGSFKKSYSLLKKLINLVADRFTMMKQLQIQYLQLTYQDCAKTQTCKPDLPLSQITFFLLILKVQRLQYFVKAILNISTQHKSKQSFQYKMCLEIEIIQKYFINLIGQIYLITSIYQRDTKTNI